MDAYRISDADGPLAELIGRAEAGESVEFERDGGIVARLVPVGVGDLADAPFDIEAIRAFAATLPFDPVDSVAEMRRQARY